YIYNSPVDKIIWDVGHQTYVHKILTSRRDDFHTLRSFRGISGFPKRKESKHDIFETGHSSTSISAALGLARARDIKKEESHVIAVIGDGALTGGMSFEALNDAGHSKTDLTVILNDNNMSISENVGALAKHLTRVRSDPKYNVFKKQMESMLTGFPLIGKHMARIVEKLKNSFKYLVVPGIIFEEMGFTYIGPVNGHDFMSLASTMERAKKMQGPVLIHVLTQKGKGYNYSELHPNQYHGVSPFDLELGCQPDKRAGLTYSAAFGKHLSVLARGNPNIVAISAAMPDGTGLNEFKQEFPDRFFDVGIAEQHAVTMAAGLAANGIRPVVAIYSTFLQRAYDQILHDVCQQNLPVVFAIDRAGLTGEDGETHQGVFDISYLQQIPNITIMAPKNTFELRSMLEYSLRMDGPVAIRYPRGRGGLSESLGNNTIMGNSWEVIQDGRDIVLLAVGSMVDSALEVSRLLLKKNVQACIINARVVKPLDTPMLDKLALTNKSNLWVTIEDNVLTGGFGSSINQHIVSNKLDVQVINYGIPDKFVEHGSVKLLTEDLGLDPDSMARYLYTILDKDRKEHVCASFK
ncbi:MAG TPA: 1-deoxy-D-xylulose-5-phosphate synthase, partial [Bacillota bacterium]|nr:1-deoxy-D-xylulose-5-phosphate synthase [Bacillota bacterium]